MEDTMSDTQNEQAIEVTRQEMSALFQRFLQTLTQSDMERWLALLDDDCVYEFPYAPRGYPQRLEGKAALREYVKDLPKHIQFFAFPEQRIHLTTDPSVLIAEVKSDGRVVATGKPYNLTYVMVVEIHNGKISHIREYWNTIAVIEALGGLDTVKAAFNVSA
jgi:ketosteroid isomerase-like protein